MSHLFSLSPGHTHILSFKIFMMREGGWKGDIKNNVCLRGTGDPPIPVSSPLRNLSSDATLRSNPHSAGKIRKKARLVTTHTKLVLAGQMKW